MNKLLAGLVIAWVLAPGMGIRDGLAQTPPPIQITVVLSSNRYILGDPNDKIAAEITISNSSCPPNGPACQTVIARAGFFDTPFESLFTFIGPDGKPVTAHGKGAAGIEGGPPKVLYVNGEPVQVDAVEEIPPNFATTITVADLRSIYPELNTTRGFFTGEIAAPIRTYPAPVDFMTPQGLFEPLEPVLFAGAILSNKVSFALIADADQDGFSSPLADSRIADPTLADCNDDNPEVKPGAVEIPNNGIDEDCNPANDVVVTPAPAPGTITVRADKHTVGSGSQPGSSKTPLVGLPVRVYSTAAGSCVQQFGVSWQHFKSIWLSCQPAANGIGTTGPAGTVAFPVAPGQYLVIGEHDPDGLPLNNDEVYLGVSAGGLASGGAVQKYLQLIVKANGKQAPAKYTTKTGSELLIIEPEYVEWTGQQELYPFIFESVGDWSVTTSVSPPQGFVADYQSLATDVNTDLKAVQFTITNVGSKWVDTEVTHDLKHRGKSEKIRSKVGVKLSEKLAKAKGLSRFGQPE